MIGARVGWPAAVLGCLGCVTVRPVQNPAQFIAQSNPKVVYVTYTNRSVVGVAQPQLRGDSLFGTLQGRAEPVVVPLSHVQQVRAAQPNHARTVLLIAGLAAFAATTVYVLSKTGPGSDCPGCYDDSVRGYSP